MGRACNTIDLGIDNPTALCPQHASSGVASTRLYGNSFLASSPMAGLHFFKCGMDANSLWNIQQLRVFRTGIYFLIILLNS